MLRTERFLWNNKHKNKILLTGNRQSWRRGIPPSVSLPGTGQIQNYVRVQCWPMRYQRKEGKKKRKKAGELPTTAQRCCYDTTKNKKAQSAQSAQMKKCWTEPVTDDLTALSSVMWCASGARGLFLRRLHEGKIKQKLLLLPSRQCIEVDVSLRYHFEKKKWTRGKSSSQTTLFPHLGVSLMCCGSS